LVPCAGRIVGTNAAGHLGRGQRDGGRKGGLRQVVLSHADRAGGDPFETVDRLGETRGVEPSHEFRDGDGKNRPSESKRNGSFDRGK
jgi:hypothetical protein